LEPAIVGLLTKTQKVILIGDHMQLPAVSTQKKETSLVAVGTPWADQIGLTDLSMSYFERLYRLFQAKGWHQLIGTLHEQGRMHEEIMTFANQFIYNGQLSCIQPGVQQQSMKNLFEEETDPLFHSRLVFIPSKSSLQEHYNKTNAVEAEITLTIIAYWKAVLKKHNLDWSIGVITPFRAQIAAILHLAHRQKIDLSDVTVDTVERYQGGARDIIIMSCTVNNSKYLQRISSLNTEGIDRKLNVAVTRARQQFVLIGVEAVLMQSNAYKALIDSCSKIIFDKPVLNNH
jgi:DNA replication ATP-dependent helicase Dna2